jgi:DNA-binding NarL/FixJ family response regulator
MRSLGLRTILEESAGVWTTSLTLESALASSAADTSKAGSSMALDAVLVDAASFEDIHATLARFRTARPELRVVVVGGPANPDHIQSVIGAGAKGYLAATATESEIRMAVEIVLDGSIWAPRKVLARLLHSSGGQVAGISEAAPVASLLTPRERDVLALLLDGRTNAEIATTLGLEVVSIKAHLGRMLRKAGAKNRVELTLRALAERE